MSKIVKISIPVDNYCGDNVFFQDYYFLAKNTRFLTQEFLCNYLTNLYNQDNEFPGYTRVHYEALQIIQLIPGNEWIVLRGNLVETNTFVIHPKWGRQSITLTLITPYQID